MKGLLLTGGKVYTGKGGFEQAVYIEDGVIKKVGSDSEVTAFAPDDAEKVDLGGRLALPGFNDSHMHLLNVGYNMSQLDLSGTKNIDEAVGAIKSYIADKQIPEGSWVMCYGWNDDNWEDKRHIDRYDLDRASEKHPVIALRICCHVASLNSAALEKIGIGKGSPQPESGAFKVDESGEPTGVMQEMFGAIFEKLPEPSVEEIKEMIVSAAQAAAEAGLTQVQSDDMTTLPGKNFKAVIQAFKELCEEDRLPIRVYEQCSLSGDETFDEFKALGYRTEMSFGNFTFGPRKLFADGSLGARTAWLKDDYSDDPGNRGIGIYKTAEDLAHDIKKARKEGMAVAIHCIGDAAAEQAVTAMEAARAEYPDVSTRDGIVHAQILNEDIMERMRKGGIIAYIQPVFIEYDLHVAESRVGKERMKTSYNWRTLRDMGIKTPFGTDCPVETFNPMPNIYTAVTRKDYDGFPEGGWYPEEGLTVEESVEDYTKTSAFACNAESHCGMIAEGFDADITVLEENLFEAEPAHIKDIKAAMTIVGGKIRFSRI